MIVAYLRQLQLLVHSRGDAQVERLLLHPVSSEEARIRGRLRFFDKSLLEFREAVAIEERDIAKLVYSYHYQEVNGNPIFRYDNAPHHPEISTHPHHKHTPSGVEPAEPPDLSDVLREIDQYLYNTGERA